MDIIREKVKKSILPVDDSVTLINHSSVEAQSFWSCFKSCSPELSRVLIIRYVHPLRKKALCGFVLYSICDKQASSYTVLFVNTWVLTSLVSIKAQIISDMNYAANFISTLWDPLVTLSSYSGFVVNLNLLDFILKNEAKFKMCYRKLVSWEILIIWLI